MDKASIPIFYLTISLGYSSSVNKKVNIQLLIIHGKFSVFPGPLSFAVVILSSLIC